MRTDVANATGDAALRRIGPPVGLLVAGAFEQRRQPALVVFDDHLADLAELAAGDHVPRLPHQRVAGVVVGDGEDDAGFLGRSEQVVRLLGGMYQRLVADDVDAGLGERLGHRVVHVVGRDDADEVDAFAGRAAQFVFEQRLPGRVVAVVGEAEFAPGGERLFGARRQRAGGELHLAVERHCPTMYAADEGALAAADHRIAQFVHTDSPSYFFSNAASKATPDGLKSTRRQKAALSVAPCTRSMRPSSHSTESGPR